MIPRLLSKKIGSLTAKFPVIAVLGPRQSGKTTLVKNLFPGMDYVSLENPDTRAFAENDPKGFLLQYQKGVILDEVQRVPELFSYIQTICDASKKTGQFILTGSENFMLSEKISQTLSGRVALLKLLPFSFDELKNTKYEQKTIEDYLFKGMYPRLYDKKIAPTDWYPNYIQTYLEKDVRSLKNVSDLHVFQKFLKLCAGRIGQIVNLSSLGNDCGISYNTVKSWLSVLESSYIIFLLQPHYRNFNKRLIKAPKLYFYDTGLACSLLGIENKKQLETHYLKGSLFESFVISELSKLRLNEGLTPNLYFWRDRMGHEIDCILETASLNIPIEIKSGKTVSEDFFKNLNYWNGISGGKPKDSYIIYGGDEEQKGKDRNVISWKNINLNFKL